MRQVEAVLETLHRSGKASGSPGAMLSQGNLNTAALTLFLAIHPSPKTLALGSTALHDLTLIC